MESTILWYVVGTGITMLGAFLASREQAGGRAVMTVGAAWVGLAILLTPIRIGGSGAQALFLSRAKQHGIALLIYASDYDDRMPRADRWQRRTAPYARNIGEPPEGLAIAYFPAVADRRTPELGGEPILIGIVGRGPDALATPGSVLPENRTPLVRGDGSSRQIPVAEARAILAR